MRWYGGKVAKRGWIDGLLGPTRRWYAEPFFGMGGGLRGRARSGIEVVSDLNNRVCNWWGVIQCDVDRFADRMARVPVARAEFLAARERLDTGTALDRAVAFATVLSQSRLASDNDDGWAPSVYAGYLEPGFRNRMRQVAWRVRHLRIDNRCASHLLKRMAPRRDAVVYVDPPYWGQSDVTAYSHHDEVDGMLDLLDAQRGRCCVSGFGDAWDALGWERHEAEYHHKVAARAGVNRTEVLWCNGR